MKKWFFFFLALSLLPGFSCDRIEKGGDKFVLTVGIRSLDEEELKAEIRKTAFEMGIPGNEIKNYLDLLLQRVIDTCLIFEYGESNGISLTEAEITTALKELENDYPKAIFKEMLLQRFIDYQDWQEDFRRQVLMRKIVSSVLEDVTPVTVEDIKRYFDNNPEEFRHEEKLMVRQILTSTREESEAVLELLHQGRDWVELAAEFSIAPEGKEGGMIGWITKGVLDESLEEVLFSLPPGQPSAVLKTPYGFHIFEVVEREPAGEKTFPRAMTEIEAKLLQAQKEAKYQEWLQALRRERPVRINHKIIEQLEFV